MAGSDGRTGSTRDSKAEIIDAVSTSTAFQKFDRPHIDDQNNQLDDDQEDALIRQDQREAAKTRGEQIGEAQFVRNQKRAFLKQQLSKYEIGLNQYKASITEVNTEYELTKSLIEETHEEELDEIDSERPIGIASEDPFELAPPENPPVEEYSETDHWGNTLETDPPKIKDKIRFSTSKQTETHHRGLLGVINRLLGR